jgi:hypothetical protein
MSTADHGERFAGDGPGGLRPILRVDRQFSEPGEGWRRAPSGMRWGQVGSVQTWSGTETWPLLAKGRHHQLGGSVGARRASSGRCWTCRAVALLLYFTAVRDQCRFRFGCQTLSAECPHAILRLVQPHIMDLSTSNSAPGEDGSKPCSISQRAATRLRHDHHARITSRSTSVP